MREAGKEIEALVGSRPVRFEPLPGGCVASVVRVDLADGRRAVVKVDPAGASGLSVEAAMLRYLAARDLPVPRVLALSGDTLLVLEHVEHDASPGAAGVHAAELLASLHGVTADGFGFECDTRIGGLRQPNGWSLDWPEFFGRRRLQHMAGEAMRAGRLGERTVRRIVALSDDLTDLLAHAPRPSLIHGDVWSGNVLTRGERVAAFIDPAVYYADAEVELAFIALFNCFGEAFWTRYHALRPIDPAFFEMRRDLYNLYPLLVHTRLFGGAYGDRVEGVLEGLGY